MTSINKFKFSSSGWVSNPKYLSSHYYGLMIVSTRASVWELPCEHTVCLLLLRGKIKTMATCSDTTGLLSVRWVVGIDPWGQNDQEWILPRYIYTYSISQKYRLLCSTYQGDIGTIGCALKRRARISHLKLDRKLRCRAAGWNLKNWAKSYTCEADKAIFSTDSDSAWSITVGKCS